MVPHLPYFVMNTLQTLMGIAVVVLLLRAKEWKSYWPLVFMAIWQAPSYFVLLYVRAQGRAHISPVRAYHLYFNSFWPACAVSAVCSIFFPYVLFRNAMRPLKGLQSLGNIVFAWVALVSCVTASSVALSSAVNGEDSSIHAVIQLQRLSAILIVSLVAFVAVAIRPMGLSVRSRVFGASIGTLVVAAVNMLRTNSMLHPQVLYSPIAMIQLTSSCLALAIWIYYFAKTEPERKFILLPTTSPFHAWNQISEVLGQEPGFVAIGGVAPEVFSDAEVAWFRNASAAMKELESPSDAPIAEPPRISPVVDPPRINPAQEDPRNFPRRRSTDFGGAQG